MTAMPLNKEALKEQLIAALRVREEEPERTVEEVAAALADAIDQFVRSGDVEGISTNVTVTVTTSGTAATQTGTGTGTGTQTGKGRIT